MSNRMRFLRSTTAAAIPPAGGSADFGRIALNLTDRKMYAYGENGGVTLLSALVGDHSATRAYSIGDLMVRQGILHRAIVNMAPKAFSAADWQTVSDFRDILLYRNPTTQDQATTTLAAGLSARVRAASGQTAPVAEWQNGAGETVSDIRADGYPGRAFGRPVFRVEQIAHGFTARGQIARFDGTNWVLANPSTSAGFAIAVVRRVLSPDAIELQTAGRIDDLQGGAFESGVFPANTRCFGSVMQPGRLTTTAPPDADQTQPILHTLTGNSAILLPFQLPMGSGGGGGGGEVGSSVEITIDQSPNPFSFPGEVAAFDGQWRLANPDVPSAAPLGIITATAGTTFTVRFAGPVSNIPQGATDLHPLTPGAQYYSDTNGKLTLATPGPNARFASPVLWATSGSGGLIATMGSIPDALRPADAGRFARETRFNLYFMGQF